MSRTGEGHQSPQTGGATATDASLGVLREHLEDEETVVYQLAGAGDIVHEDDDGAEQIAAAAGGDVMAVITDRRVYFAAITDTGVDVAALRYRNVREIVTVDGLLRRRLEIRVWGEGTYRFKPARGEPIDEAGDFVQEAGQVWQRVLAALEAAREQITSLGKHVEGGAEADATSARGKARDQIDVAEDRIEDAPPVLQDALAERVREVQTELQRTRVRSHLKRGQTLIETARSRATDRDWTDAERALCEAQRHTELARKVAALAGFDVLEAIDRELVRIEDLTTEIADQPRQLAVDAQVTAEAAQEPENAVPAWASALAGYRDAIGFDWGGRLGVERNTEKLRERVEKAAGNLIAARRDLAEKLRGEAADARMAGQLEAATDRYEAALTQLSMAESLAGELDAGDPEAIADERETVRSRFELLEEDGVETAILTPKTEPSA